MEQATSHYLNQWCLSLLTHIYVTQPDCEISLYICDTNVTTFVVSYPHIRTWFGWRSVGLYMNYRPSALPSPRSLCSHSGTLDEKGTTLSWWRHEMETLSALLALCAGNSPVTGEFTAQRPVTRIFDVSFDLRLNKHLRKQSWGWWFDTPSRSLWRHRNDNDITYRGRKGKTITTTSHKCQTKYMLLKPKTNNGIMSKSTIWS